MANEKDDATKSGQSSAQGTVSEIQETVIRSIGFNVNVPSSFDKLKGAENYMDWRFAMEAHLFNVGLWEHVDGTYQDVYQGKRARGAIISGVQSQLFSSIRDLVSGEEVWNRLEKLFQPRGLYREVALLEELTSIRFSDCPDMETYLNKKVTAAQRLSAINSKVEDRLLAGLILMKLPEEFNPLIQSISGVDDAITTDFVKQRLLAEAARQTNQKQEAALASRYSRPGQRSKPKRDASKGEQNPGTTFRGKCNRCQKQGHMAKHCNSPKDQGKIAEVLPVDQLDRALRCSEEGSDGWYIDSGASTHMTGNRDLFIDLQETARGRSIATANNEILTCQGTGDVRITCVIGNKEEPVRLRDVMYVPGLSVNLISVKQLTEKGFSVNFNNSQRCEIKDSSGGLFAGGGAAVAASID